jgi:hypothetical protein
MSKANQQYTTKTCEKCRSEITTTGVGALVTFFPYSTNQPPCDDCKQAYKKAIGIKISVARGGGGLL